MPNLSIMRLKQNVDEGLPKMSFEELEMRGLVPQLSNYNVIYTKNLSDEQMGKIFDGSHEWIRGKAIQVSDIIRIDSETDPRFYYRNINGYVQLEFEMEMFHFNLQDGEMLVLVVPPLDMPFPSAIHCSIDAMRTIVGGDADITPLYGGAAIVTKKEEQCTDEAVNRTFNGRTIAGTFFICGLDEDHIPCSLTEEQFGSFYVQFKLA